MFFTETGLMYPQLPLTLRMKESTLRQPSRISSPCFSTAVTPRIIVCALPLLLPEWFQSAKGRMQVKVHS